MSRDMADLLGLLACALLMIGGAFLTAYMVVRGIHRDARKRKQEGK